MVSTDHCVTLVFNYVLCLSYGTAYIVSVTINDRAFGWTDSRTEHEVQFKYDNVSGKKAITMDGKDIYNEINTSKGLSHCWETSKGHLLQIEHLDQDVVFSIDETRFEEFMFPRPIRTKEEVEALDASSDEGGDLDNDEDASILSKLVSPFSYDDEEDTKCQYNLDIEVINPTTQKNENYVTYTVRLMFYHLLLIID